MAVPQFGTIDLDHRAWIVQQAFRSGLDHASLADPADSRNKLADWPAFTEGPVRCI
jgi:hypothetical protein